MGLPVVLCVVAGVSGVGLAVVLCVVAGVSEVRLPAVCGLLLKWD